MDMNIFSTLQEISFSIYNVDLPKKQLDKLTLAVKKYLKKENENVTRVIDEINQMGIKKIRIKTIYPVSDYYTYVFSLLRTCSKNAQLGTAEIQSLQPVVIEIGSQKEGYSLQKYSFPKRYHNRLWKLKNATFSYQKIYDYYTVIASVYVESVLEKFIFSRHDLLRYLAVKKFVNMDLSPVELKVPTNQIFCRDFVAVFEKYWGNNYVSVSSSIVDRYSTVFYLNKICSTTKQIMIPELIKRIESVKIKRGLEKFQNAHYARTFETKKNISCKIKKIMDDNVFLDYFGYVELDNSIIEQEFRVWEQDFLELKKIFPLPKTKDHSFRVKKLGKYASEGLYFPRKKALVIDTKHPQSFFHEIGHLIDYLFGQNDNTLSDEISFRHIADVYKLLVTKNILTLPSSHQMKKKWFGKSKFNQDYYCQNTEIFARSLELYFCEKKVSNILTEQNIAQNILYPQDCSYIKMVNKYIDEVLLPMILSHSQPEVLVGNI